MKVFLSSTFLDLQAEREVVLRALRQKRMSTLATEDFLATPTTTSQTALDNLRNSDVMILVVGFKAGSLLSDGSGRTYTWDEYEELLRLGREALVFLKTERRWSMTKTVPWAPAQAGLGKRRKEEFREMESPRRLQSSCRQ